MDPPSKQDISKEDCDAETLKPQVLDGGKRGWSTVAGCWLILTATFGYTYTFGVFQDYYTRIYLPNDSPSSISWIGGVQLTIPFFMGTFSGHMFDRGYFHTLQIAGGVVFTFSLFMLSLCKRFQYYQVILSQGIGMGIGFGLIFVPSLAVQAHHFKKRRALAMGIILSGTSIGGIVFPIMLNHLLQNHSFGRAVRSTAYIVLGCLIIGNCLIRLPVKMLSPPSPRTDSIQSTGVVHFFKELPYTLLLFNALLAAFGLYFPVIYGQLYSVQHDVDPILAFYMLPILNASSAVGRILGNMLADSLGPFTILAPCTLLSGVSLWLILLITNRASLIIVSILNGFFSGAYLSLLAVAIAFISNSPKEVGVRTGLVSTCTGIGALFAAPIQGALATRSFTWIRPVAFSASLLFGAALAVFIIRFLLVKERGSQRV